MPVRENGLDETFGDLLLSQSACLSYLFPGLSEINFSYITMFSLREYKSFVPNRTLTDLLNASRYALGSTPVLLLLPGIVSNG